MTAQILSAKARLAELEEAASSVSFERLPLEVIAHASLK